MPICAGPQDDYAVAVGRKQHLRPYDALLKRFQYQRALDAVLGVRARACGPQSLAGVTAPRAGPAGWTACRRDCQPPR